VNIQTSGPVAGVFLPSLALSDFEKKTMSHTLDNLMSKNSIKMKIDVQSANS